MTIFCVECFNRIDMIRKFLMVLLLVAWTISAGAQEVKNVILMIGDGMGLAQVQAAMMQSKAPLQLERAQYIGLSKTYSANNRVTDSAAGGTALATGHKTNNGMVGVLPDGTAVQNIRELAQQQGLATGVVVTKDITDATPASFLAHRESRKMADDIAQDIVASGVDLFMGGGRVHFAEREDGEDLLAKLKKEGYTLVEKKDKIADISSGKVAGLFSKKHMKRASDVRGDYLPVATRQAMKILHKNSPDGFFLMVEGSQIDSGGHANDGEFVVTETLDFDLAVGEAFDFADKNPGTLVIITADHETGGLSLPSGDEDFLLGDQGVEMKFGTGGHSAIMVPVYAYGTGAEQFSTIMENTDIPRKIAALMELKMK